MRFVLLDDQVSGQQRVFKNPKQIISANNRADLPKAFAAIEHAQAAGKWLAGYLSYELGYALERRFDELDGPLMRLGVFEAPTDAAPPDWLYTQQSPKLDLVPDWNEAEYLKRFEAVQAYLRSGDCYQVNLTFPLRAQTDASATELYAAFRQRQPGRYGSVVSLDETDLISFSPELFFDRSGRHMRMRPMKGTRPRAGIDDLDIAAAMQAEPKSRAENLMIVDLLRNDLSRLCVAGSVKVPELFSLEAYPTLYQMTSQVTGDLREDVSWEDIIRGLFPCGSITGAPKIRAMEIIKELECGPRSAYCGSVGFIAPNGDASFSVAIRTMQLNKSELRYDVGSGVVLDSDGPDEYRECLLKAKILETKTDGVIETFRRKSDGSIPRRDLHISRLVRSDVADKKTIETQFNAVSKTRPGEDLRIRLEVNDNKITLSQTPYMPIKEPVRLACSRYALTPLMQDTSVKTTHRDFYDGERARLKALIGADEVIFLNTHSYLCEGSYTSLFIEHDGVLLTPSLSSGLLPGVLRQSLINLGDAKEAELTLADLKRADAIFVGNSLRGLMPATFIDYERH